MEETPVTILLDVIRAMLTCNQSALDRYKGWYINHHEDILHELNYSIKLAQKYLEDFKDIR